MKQAIVPKRNKTNFEAKKVLLNRILLSIDYDK